MFWKYKERHNKHAIFGFNVTVEIDEHQMKTWAKRHFYTQLLQLNITQDSISFHMAFTYRGLQPYEACVITCISMLLNNGRTCVVIFFDSVYV